MKRAAIAQSILSSVFLLCSANAVHADELFGNSLFPAESDKPLFSDFSSNAQSYTKKNSAQSAAAQKEQMKALLQSDDDEMRRQMQKVAGWLQEFCLRNQNRFPGNYGSSGTIERAAEVQLTELVGSNPYANAIGAVQDGELNGLSPGLSYYYNSDGTPNTSGPVANDEWTAELTADNAHRIQLAMDQSINPTTLDEYRKSPPLNWTGQPGTIYGYGDGQGNLYVWGAGFDGKPLKNPGGMGTYILFAQTANNVEDQGQEANY